MREQQRLWAAEQSQVQIVSAVDLELTDPIHLSTAGLKRLGRRLARASFGQAGLTPVSLSWLPSQRTLRLELGGVDGELHAPSQPLGFSVRDAKGHDLHCIQQAEIDGHSMLLHLNEWPLPDSAQLWYGFGLDPVCNVVDSHDQALLTFGPWLLSGREL